MLVQRLSVWFSLIYSLASDCDKVFVVGQYSNDYFDSQNAISNDAYYYSNGRQYNDPEPDTDIGATVLIESSINKISYVFNERYIVALISNAFLQLRLHYLLEGQRYLER